MDDISGEVNGVPTLDGELSELLVALRLSELVLDVVEERLRG